MLFTKYKGCTGKYSCRNAVESQTPNNMNHQEKFKKVCLDELLGISELLVVKNR